MFFLSLPEPTVPKSGQIYNALSDAVHLRTAAGCREPTYQPHELFKVTSLAPWNLPTFHHPHHHLPRYFVSMATQFLYLK